MNAATLEPGAPEKRSAIFDSRDEAILEMYDREFDPQLTKRIGGLALDEMEMEWGIGETGTDPVDDTQYDHDLDDELWQEYLAEQDALGLTPRVSASGQKQDQ